MEWLFFYYFYNLITRLWLLEDYIILINYSINADHVSTAIHLGPILESNQEIEGNRGSGMRTDTWNGSYDIIERIMENSSSFLAPIKARLPQPSP